MNKLILCGTIVAAAIITSCSDKGNDSEITPPDNRPAKLVLACDMNVNGSDVSYLVPVVDAELQGGSANLALSHEVYGNAYIEGYRNWVFHLPVWKEATVYRYSRQDDGSLLKDGSLQLSDNAGAGLVNLLFLSETKAYATLGLINKIVVFNPSTMTKTKEIDLAKPQFSFDGQSTPNPAGMVYRDGKVFVGCMELADMPICNNGAYAIVIDEATDAPQKFISDMRATSASFFNHSMFADEKGDIYVTCWASYGYTPAEYGQKGGFLRIKKGETEFDPDYFFNITDMTFPSIEGGKLQYVASAEYASAGIAYGFGSCPAFFTGDWVHDKTHYSLKIDLYNQTIDPLPLPRTNGYSCSISKLGNDILFGLTTTSNGTGLFSYNHSTGASSTAPIVNAPGTIMDVAVFE
ncbi:MAG: DUF4374 domain-containing protein [Tannerellaceae bacterium]|jgi:hypothetical protein|nr:DUF4374 domain-containing protein [Tannerellaceae bacterium]